MGKRLGQHFLIDDQWAQKMAHLAKVNAQTHVLEIGPGHGALTQALLGNQAKVHAIELDTNLVTQLHARWQHEPRLEIVHGNALTCDFDPEILFKSKKPYIITANLPYYLTTPFLFRVLRARQYIVHTVFMIQREVAMRICAEVTDKKRYGALSIAMQHAFQTQWHHAVEPGAFRPKPKVHSAIVALTPLAMRFDEEKEKAFLHHVKQLFTRRRKRLLSVLRTMYPQVFWQHSTQSQSVAQLVGERRAEALSVQEHETLFCMLYTQ